MVHIRRLTVKPNSYIALMFVVMISQIIMKDSRLNNAMQLSTYLKIGLSICTTHRQLDDFNGKLSTRLIFGLIGTLRIKIAVYKEEFKKP